MDHSSAEKDNTVKEWNYHLTTTFIVCAHVKQWKLLQTGMPLSEVAAQWQTGNVTTWKYSV